MFVSGKDSEEFLARVTAGTVKGVTPGSGTGGLLLNGQSRMLALFDLLRMGPEEFLLAAPDACASSLAEGLERLHFSEDLSFRASGKLSARPSKNIGREKVFSHATGPTWPSPVPGYEYYLSDDPSFPESWDFDRIGALVSFPGDWDATTPALEAGVLALIDRFKGCYPGQEVVERSLNVGHPARILVAMEGVGVLEPGTKVPLEGGGEGLITSVATREGLLRAFVRVPWAKKESTVAGFRLLRE